jgi:membrane protein required for beta-lactamase induction
VRVRTRPRPTLALGFSLLLTLPILAACSGNAEDDVREAAQAFLDAWAEGDVAAAADATDDGDAATALLEQTATDLPEAQLAHELGAVTVEDGTATVA